MEKFPNYTFIIYFGFPINGYKTADNLQANPNFLKTLHHGDQRGFHIEYK